MTKKKAATAPARVASFEEACKNQGLDHNQCMPDVSSSPEKDRAALIAFAKMCVIQRDPSINGDWVPDWNDSDEAKYYPWFDVEEKEEGPSGFGLSFDDCAFDYSDPYLGVRLFYKDSDTARYMGEHFSGLYEEMMLIPR